MKVGLQVYHFDWPGSPENVGPKLVEIARTAENAGFSSIWVMDHFFQVGQGFGPPEAPMLEGYSVMAYLAAVTQHMKLGLMVTGNPYRHPGVLIKTVTTLDVLSGGRAYLGIGTGWCEPEARCLGIPFPSSRKELVGRFEETLQIAKHMWSNDYSPFEGEYYHLLAPINHPPPLTRPHPPILIGCEKETKMLKLVARYADAVNFHLGTPLTGFWDTGKQWYDRRLERLPRKLQKLKGYCKEIGRPFNDIEKTTLATIKLDPKETKPEDLVTMCRELDEMGFDHAIFNMPNVHEVEPLRTFGDAIIPEVRNL